MAWRSAAAFMIAALADPLQKKPDQQTTPTSGYGRRVHILTAASHGSLGCASAYARIHTHTDRDRSRITYKFEYAEKGRVSSRLYCYWQGAKERWVSIGSLDDVFLHFTDLLSTVPRHQSASTV